ncbi:MULTISPECIES: FecR domain-containing protein [unclassified Microbulbifer]|uniref:FecR family protein n=1 Tax=unclassified Microbulbifer TaxID=2619833 RepID=UPI0027E4D337|nr:MULTISPECIES: FecR domain-containing protein [unclassified Microbulbifer]
MAQGRSQRLVDERARSWFMLRHERNLSPREEAEFERWMEEPSHRASYRQLEQVDRGLLAIAATAEGERLRAQTARTGWRERLQRTLSGFLRGAPAPAPAPALAMALVVFMAVGLASINLGAPGSDPAPGSYKTGIAQTRTITLQDGSEVTLGADSQIEFTFAERRRDISLLKGQAFFSVATDPARPFFVNTDNASVRVVGTRFEVHRAPGGVKVSVEEGIVDVTHVDHVDHKSRKENRNTAATRVRLLAGQRVRVSAEGSGNVETIGADELASWRRGKLVYRNARLSEVVADANRYRPGGILLGAPQLAELRVTTSFSVNQVETMISMLEQSLPVSVYREADNRIVIWPRTTAN